jgi:DNA-directed RNA polymerase alpha subunit
MSGETSTEYDDDEEPDFITLLMTQFFRAASATATQYHRELPTYALELPVRVENALYRAGYSTIGAIIDAGLAELYSVPRFGIQARFDLVQALWHRIVRTPITPFGGTLEH